MAKSKETALATNTTGSALAIPEDMLNLYAEEKGAEENLRNVANAFFMVSTKGNRFRVGGELIGDKGTEFSARIMRMIPVRIYYESKYDADNPIPPDCASVGGLYPDSNGKKIQAPACAGCPQNKWGTSKGPDGQPTRGKACRETKRLVLQVEGVSLPCILSVPPTSGKNIDEYLKKLSSVVPGGIPVWAALTKFIADGDEFIIIRPELLDVTKDKDEFLTLKILHNNEIYTNAERAYATGEELGHETPATEGQETPAAEGLY